MKKVIIARIPLLAAVTFSRGVEVSRQFADSLLGFAPCPRESLYRAKPGGRLKV